MGTYIYILRLGFPKLRGTFLGPHDEDKSVPFGGGGGWGLRFKFFFGGRV